MKKKDTTSEGASEWSSAPTGRITPSDVQQKEFRVARFGAGYRVREVDEFLDQVTDTLSALTAENERLLRGAGDLVPASSPPSPRPSDESDRAGVDAFLRREKGFLQDLGGLVQAHAEELRTMIRAVRRDAAASAADTTPAEASGVRPGPATQAAPDAQTQAMPDAMPEATNEAAAPPEGDSPSPEGIEGTQEPAPDDAEDDTPSSAGSPTATGVIADEPIRLEEPEPARSRRSDDEEGGSLRELFWGEE
ncbi:MAG TPA: DivIVA domain-containing protein [Actinomycetota bacterium]|jgi:DivIVA domain-containing protein|nr:DivIVA domain-containing protein [Actinomycetota bacterium]